MAEVGGVARLFGLGEGGREAGHDGVQVVVGDGDGEVVLDEAAAGAGAAREGPPELERSRM